MLAELKAIHDDLREAIAVLAAETALAAPHDETLSAARLRLSRTSHRRRSLLETSVYPLLHEAGPIVAGRIAALRAEAAALLIGSSQHISQWTTRAIHADWPGYQRASANLRRRMLERIADEAAILYPLLEPKAA